MDGWMILRRLSSLLGENSTSRFIDDQTSYEFAYDAVLELVRRTNLLTGEQTETTVSNQRAYDLNPDFLGFWLTDDRDETYYIWIDDGNTKMQCKFRSYDAVNAGWTTISPPAVTFPYNFTTIETDTDINITGDCTSDGDGDAGNESILTDSSAPFGNVCVGDRVINSDDGSDGYVISLTSSSAVVTSLFGGTDNEWDSGDAYVIVPQQRYSLLLDPLPSVDGYTVTIPYVKRPSPVYSKFRRYNIPDQLVTPVLEYTAFLYKYRDREPRMGDALYQHFDQVCRSSLMKAQDTKQKPNMRVYMKKTAFRYGTRR